MGLPTLHLPRPSVFVWGLCFFQAVGSNAPWEAVKVAIAATVASLLGESAKCQEETSQNR